MSFKGSENRVPEHTMETLNNYFKHGFAPGGFVTALLANDLMSAVAKADFINIKMIGDIATWVCHNAPDGSWGSYDIVQGWLDKNEYFKKYQKQLVINILSKTKEEV